MLQTKTVEPITLELLKSLMAQPCLRQFVLAGGTALALQIGHRKSIDLDFFTTEDFYADELLTKLLKDYHVRVQQKMQQTLLCDINGVKVDFIRFRYPLIRPVISINNIRMLDIEDIAPMKLDAIAGRGSKKDFFDVFFLLQQFKLEQLFSLYTEKYPHQTTFHVLKSLSWFEDAETDPDPLVFDKTVTWSRVKKEIIQKLKQL